jgi:hypothetical protein
MTGIAYSRFSGELAAAYRRRPRRPTEPTSPCRRWILIQWIISKSKLSQQNPISVNLASFSKEPLYFLQINPPSCAVQKYLQKVLFLLFRSLNFLVFFARRPIFVLLCISPSVYMHNSVLALGSSNLSQISP